MYWSDKTYEIIYIITKTKRNMQIVRPVRVLFLFSLTINFTDKK